MKDKKYGLIGKLYHEVFSEDYFKMRYREVSITPEENLEDCSSPRDFFQRKWLGIKETRDTYWSKLCQYDTFITFHKDDVRTHIENIYNHKGIAFLIIRFTSLNETYLLLAKDFLSFIKDTQRKSIPISFFKEKAYQIKDGYRPRVDYLKIIDEVIGGI